METCALLSLCPGWYFVVPNWRAGLRQRGSPAVSLGGSSRYAQLSPRRSPQHPSTQLRARRPQRSHFTDEDAASQRGKVTGPALRRGAVGTRTLNSQAPVSRPEGTHGSSAIPGGGKPWPSPRQTSPGLKLNRFLFHYDRSLHPGRTGPARISVLFLLTGW